MNYQDCMCPKCHKAIFRSEGTRFCQFCGAELPEYKPEPITCPCCRGTGKIEPWQVGQPWYGAIVTNDLTIPEKYRKKQDA